MYKVDVKSKNSSQKWIWILLKWRGVGEAGKVIKIDTKEFQHFPIWKFYLIGVCITEATTVNILSMFPS